MMKIVQMTSAEFVGAVLSGDPARRNRAFRLLYDNRMILAKIAEWRRFYNFAKAETDDILQEGILLLDRLVREGKYRGESKVETFLLALCKNLIRDGMKKVDRVVLKGEIDDATTGTPDLVADQITFTEQHKMASRRDEILNQTLEEMRENCRDSLKMYYYQNQTMKQVAEKRDLANADQAKKAVHRCREQLRALLTENPALINILNQLS